jgi:hypothetical protein
MMTLACHLALRPQEAAPETKLFDPADFIDQLVFLARVLLLIPHNSTLCFPVHIDSCGKARNWEDCGTACDCRHRFNLLFLKLHAFIRSFDQNAFMQSQFHHIAFGTGRKRNRRYDYCRKEIRVEILLRMTHCSKE